MNQQILLNVKSYNNQLKLNKYLPCTRPFWSGQMSLGKNKLFQEKFEDTKG